jgi:type IV secretion system protein VirD4
MALFVSRGALFWTRVILATLVGASAWTALASLVFLAGTGLIRSFDHPFYQWWLYLLYAPDDRTIALWLKLSAGSASTLLGGFAVFLLFGTPEARRHFGRLLQTKVPAPVRGKSDNHGHADWLSMDKARALFPGPSPDYGGLVVGEAYRVDQDVVADRPFDPADKASWGKGGTAPLLIDPCRSGPTHSLIFAGAGSFKSTSAVSTLLTWTGSTVVLDPSGELGPMLSRARQAMGHTVHELSLDNGAGFNVLDWIDIKAPMAITNVLSVADWIAGDASANASADSSFFASRGKAMIACLLAHMLWDPHLAPEQKTLRQLRNGLARPEKEMRQILAAIHATSHSSLARDYAGTLMGIVDETFSGIYANADESSAWLANDAFSALVSGNSFTSSEILSGKCSIFLQISLKALQTTPAVGRTVIGALLNAAYEADGRSKGRILYLLDEVARLGPMKIIETARDAGRKYGITLQLLYQSVGQLEKQWGKEGKREWYDGVSHRTYAAVQDLDTARELEESFGQYGVESVSEGSNKGSSGKAFSLDSLSRGTNISYQEMARPLIRKDELMNDCRTDEAFIVIRGAKPLRCGRAIYFRRPELDRQIAANRFQPGSPQAG